MKMKKILPLALILLVGLSAFVSAVSFTTEIFDSGYSTEYFRDNFGIENLHAYRVNYNINKAGWYLLPSGRGEVQLASLSEQKNQDIPYEQIHKAYDYRYALSPFTKKYIRCERQPYSNPLVCDIAEILDESESYLNSLPEDKLNTNYMAYLGLNADWYYYSKPTTVSFDFHPININKLFNSKLKAGWNLITYPSHVAYGEVTIGDCNIERLYAWDDGNQVWDKFPDTYLSDRARLVDELTDGKEALSGIGMAIKVTNGCTLITKKGSLVSGEGPPAIPN